MDIYFDRSNKKLSTVNNWLFILKLFHLIASNVTKKKKTLIRKLYINYNFIYYYRREFLVKKKKPIYKIIIFN